MDNINYKHLISLVKNGTKKNYLARYHDDKLVANFANLGGKIGDVYKRSAGEYGGIEVRILENAPVLLTDHVIIRILKRLDKQDYHTPLDILSVYNTDMMCYMLSKWFTKATVGYGGEFNIYEKRYPELDDRIWRVAHDPIPVKIQIVNIGFNTNTKCSVLPDKWMDRIFPNASELHREMDQLESRMGKPSTTFAVICSMIKSDENNILHSISNIEYDNIIYLRFNGTEFNVQYTLSSEGKYQYVKYDKLVIGFQVKELLVTKEQPHRTESAGILASRLQKCIRNGRYGSRCLIETVDIMNQCPNYNLPQHGFVRVSASKQLAWRLFISIMEDCRPYTEIYEPSLLHLILLTLITQRLTEYSFNNNVLTALKFLALVAQYNDSRDDSYAWRAQPVATSHCLNTHNEYQTALALAIDHIPMMKGDILMLKKYYSANEDIFPPFEYPSVLNNSNWPHVLQKTQEIYHDYITYQDIMTTTYDQHTHPYIILYYQAVIGKTLTTRQISGHIWDVSSAYNVRTHRSRTIDPVLRTIQEYIWDGGMYRDVDIVPSILTYRDNIPDRQTKRSSFLIMFGRKYRYRCNDIVLAGTAKLPACVKENGVWINYSRIDILNAFPEQTIALSKIDPPYGYRWKYDSVTVAIRDAYPYINDERVKYFDGSSVLELNTPIISQRIGSSDYQVLVDLFSCRKVGFTDIIYYRTYVSNNLVDWTMDEADRKSICPELAACVYTKLFDADNKITIGPVTRSGDKMQNAIDYYLEGKLWAIFSVFSYLYPNVIKPSGSLNFKLNKSAPGYIHLIETLRGMIFYERKITGIAPIIKTKLWDHQKDSVAKITKGFDNGQYGFGDASDVGAGKTLISLSIAAKLMAEDDPTYCGVLVLLPNDKLIATWKEEINKHTEGFDVIYHDKTCDVGHIMRNTLVISTMARSRDYPIHNFWKLIIIDECLTIQNRDALWTKCAWKQSKMSKHLIMMSATFFRARFDKLYYMLKMLHSGFPERKEYLDVILLETIVSQVSSVQRKWLSSVHRFRLPSKTRTLYDTISSNDLSIEKKYTKLSSLLVRDKHAVRHTTRKLSELIHSLEARGSKCLIYARSVDEARIWSDAMDIPIYPKKSTHCIVTYNDGTYGLNDLVAYDTIVMRPPVPDKLPQIKGRLDRPGQKSNQLYLEYFVYGDTLEEGLLIRMELAGNFIKKYIMPLSKFYDISVNFDRYSG